MKGLILTYLLSGGGAVVGVFNPYWGVLVYVALSILKPASLWFWSVPIQPYSKPVALSLLIGWMLRGFGNWNFRRGGAVGFALVAYWAWTLVGYLLAPDEDSAFRYFDTITKIILPAVVGLTLMDSVLRLKQLAWTIVICQGYVAFEMNMSYLGGFNRLRDGEFGWMDNNCNAIAFVTCVGLALFLILASPRWWQKVIALGLALLLAHAVVLAFSRGALLAMIMTGLASFVMIPKKTSKHYLFFVVAVLIGFRMAGSQVQERFSTTFAAGEERDESAQFRLRHWKACLQHIRDNPLFGAGPAHWHLTAPQYGLPKMEAHSLWLQISAEQGLPGILSLGLFYVICVVRLWPITRERYYVSDPWLNFAARMTFSALVGFFVSAQFVSVQALEVPYFVCILGAGVLKVVSQQDAEHRALLPQAQMETFATVY